MRRMIAICGIALLSLAETGCRHLAAASVGRGNAKATVLDLRVVQTNAVWVGTKYVATADVTNLLARLRGRFDAVALHIDASVSADRGPTSELLRKIFKLGYPDLFVDDDRPVTAPTEAPAINPTPAPLRPSDTTAPAGLRSLSIGSDDLTDLYRKLAGKSETKSEEDRSALDLRSIIGWDPTKKAYALDGVQIGLPGKHVWLFYEQDEEGRGQGGIQLRQEW